MIHYIGVLTALTARFQRTDPAMLYGAWPTTSHISEEKVSKKRPCKNERENDIERTVYQQAAFWRYRVMAWLLNPAFNSDWEKSKALHKSERSWLLMGIFSSKESKAKRWG